MASSPEFYAIHELAEHEFDGDIATTLGISRRTQGAFTMSANNLAALEGGRHADSTVGAPSPPLDLDGQRRYAINLLRKWIEVRRARG